MENENKYPDSYYCPITGELMVDPVIDNDGNTYEREVILAWLAKNETSPMTRKPLKVSDLRPNRALKDCIDLVREKAVQKIRPAVESASSKQGQEIVVKDILEIGAVSFNASKSFLVDLKLTAPSAAHADTKERANVELVAIVDTSGSMRGAKINLVQDSLEFVLSQLQEEDSFCLTEFHSRAELCFPLRKLTEKARPNAMTAVDKLKDKGSTNMLDGLGLSLQQIQGPTTGNGVCSLMLFTDGHPDSKNGIIACIEENLVKVHASGRTACTLHTFGYGADHDATFLMDIAQKGNGSYYFLGKPEDIPTSFADALGGLLSVFAQNIVLTITARVPIKQVLTKFPMTHPDSKTWRVQMPDLFCEESRDVLVECMLDQLSECEKEQALFEYSLSYSNSISKREVSLPSQIVTISRPMNVNELDFLVNEIVDIQRNRIICTEALAAGRLLADAQKLVEARQQLQDAIEKIQKSVSSKLPEAKGFVKDLEEAKGEMKEKDHYMRFGQKNVMMQEQSHSRQRAQKADSDTYQTSAKQEMQVRNCQVQSSLSDDRYSRRSEAQTGYSGPSPSSRPSPSPSSKSSDSSSNAMPMNRKPQQHQRSLQFQQPRQQLQQPQQQLQQPQQQLNNNNNNNNNS